MTKYMKAAILVKPNEPLVVDEVEIPELDVGQVLVKIAYSGICGKQIDEITGKQSDPYLPHLLGHEGSGHVVETGPGVKKVKEDDAVVLHWMKSAGIDSNTPKYKWNGKPVNAGSVTTFNEYAVVSENRMTKIPNNTEMDIAALLGCAVTTGLGIVFNNANLKPGQSIAVFGVGGVGINVLQGAQLVNAYPIVAVDLYDNKLEQAKFFGATHVINAKELNLEMILKELSSAKGFDVTVDTTGNNKVRELAYNNTSNTGKTILAGVPSQGDKMVIDSFPLHFGRQMFGSHGGNTVQEIDIPRYLQLYKLQKLNLKEQISHRYDLENINVAIEKMMNGEVNRCAIKCTG